MTQPDVIETVRGLGWSVHRVAGGPECRFTLLDRMLTITPRVRTGSVQTLRLNPGVGTAAFDRAYDAVSGDRDRVTHPFLHDFGDTGTIRTDRLSEGDVRSACARILDWAAAQDLDQEVRRLSEAPTDSPGNLPVMHLAALALTGQLDRLREYAASFARGDRLGFVPYIDRGHLERAISHAMPRAADERDAPVA
ncbi:DUF6990 domain-containing protein [Microbacterium karelineae]|uniref:DUF6990 domain-containing protein n=1 Tax=Microbacterium karelineae TaxID=2654283 RepID=UPI0012EAA894|nr:hypothetical protein [Microbacterium karelineae]